MSGVVPPKIKLAHGSGGRAMRTLIEQVFVTGAGAPAVAAVGLAAMDDGAVLQLGDQLLVLTTDSHVVQPLFFPGGDIGRLAVSGTVNDLAVMGATEPLGLTCAVIVEEGFPTEVLERVQASIRETCEQAGTSIVTGDTKVMRRGEVDGLVLNTAGIGIAERVVRDDALRPGDALIMTGSMGDHGLAIMATRNDLALEGPLQSDVQPLNGLIRLALRAAGDAIVAMKDPTRGGVASALHEFAAKSRVGIEIDESALVVHPEVAAAGELLGIDPLTVANEGKALIAVRASAAEALLRELRTHPLGAEAAIIGRATDERPGSVILDTGFGRRLVSEPEGEQLPRIC